MEEMKDPETLGLKSLFVKALFHWKLFVGVFLFSIIPAVLYLLLYPRTYEISAQVKIQEDKDLGGGSFGLGEAAGLMKSFGLGGIGGGGAINIEDELAMFSSNKLLRSMVLDLGINAEYTKPWSFYRLYGEDTLFKLTADSLTNATLEEEIEFVVKLSGGQCQRLALARGLLHDSPIYIFDEATSNIDADSENHIVSLIQSLAGKKTVIMIYHRLASIREADNICVLEKGLVAESGTHQALLNQKGVYARLYTAQQELETYAQGGVAL